MSNQSYQSALPLTKSAGRHSGIEMSEKSDNNSATAPKPKGRRREIAAVFTIQLLLVIALVQLDKIIGFGGNLHLLVGVVFILLPVMVLDRTDRPYDRYGFSLGKPHIDLLWVSGAALLLFPPIAYFAPTVWGIKGAAFHWVLPEGYPSAIFAHLLVTALPEEVFYRGYLLGRLDDAFPQRIRLLGASVGPGLLIQAALFAAGHYLVDFNPGRLAVFFPALAFGWLKAERGTLGAPILFHAAGNIFMDIFRAGLGF